MKKQLLCLLCVCVITSTAFAAGKSDGGTAAKAKATLVVYSPQADADRGSWIESQAEAALGFDIEFLCASGGDLAERVIAERANPQADVVMGLVQTNMYQLKAEGLLEPYTPAWTTGLPDAYKDPEGYFYSFWQTPIVIAYNPEFVKNPPKDWLALGDAEWKDKFIVGNSGGQTTRTYLLGMLAYFYDAKTGQIKEEGWEQLRKFYANAYGMPVSTSDQWAMMKDGSVPVMLNWFGGVKQKAVQNGVKVEYVRPSGGTPIVAEGIGLVKGCKNPENAKAFIEWWGKPETMAAYAAQFGQAPAHPLAIAMCPADVKADAEMFKAQPIDYANFSKKTDEWFTKIELEIIP